MRECRVRQKSTVRTLCLEDWEYSRHEAGRLSGVNRGTPPKFSVTCCNRSIIRVNIVSVKVSGLRDARGCSSFRADARAWRSRLPDAATEANARAFAPHRS